MGWIGSQCSFSSNDGDHSAYIEDSLVFVRMHDVNDLEERNTDYIANTGSPHYLIFGSQIDQMEITHAARKIRYSDEFSSEGININYLENSGDLLKVRTYERGVEDETLSCGTGVTAAALVNFKKLEKDPGQHVQKIQTLGGELQVHFETDGTKFWNIVLAGPAEFVFRGRIEI
jgi:diaminopimelate epimerase